MDRWHDPSWYGYGKKDDSLIGDTIGLLFTADEVEGLEKRIANAKLNVRKGWISVPKLNLGTTKLPTLGQKRICDDELVMKGSTLLIEELSKLNVMTKTEAEELISRKLIRYFLHERGFQLSKDRALGILGSLNNKTEGVALVR